MIQLILALGMTASASAEAPDETLRFILDGQPAVLTAADVRSARADLRTSLSLLALDLKLETADANCIRFAAVLNDLTEQISTMVEEERSFRQRLLINAFFSLGTMFHDGAEGGYGTLDMRPQPCAWRDRASLKAQMNSLTRQITDYSRNVLGGTGLRELDASEEKLLLQARHAESSRRTRDWALIGGTTVASIVFWGYAPAGVAVLARAAGGLPGFLEAPAVVLGIRSSAFAAEGLAIYWMQETWTDSEDTRGSLPPSWESELEAMELFLSHADLPEMHLLYLSQIRAQLARLYEPWLNRHRAALPQDAVLREVDARLAMGKRLAGLTVPEQNSVLEARAQALGYRARCAPGMISGSSSFTCAIGFRHLVLAAETGDLPAAAKTARVLRITFTASRGTAVSEDLNGVNLDVPSVSNPSDLRAAVQAALENPLARKHLQQQTLFEEDVAALEQELPLPVEFAEGLDRPSKWQAVHVLRGLAADAPELFQNLTAERLRLGSYFAPVYEDGARLVQTLSVYGTADQIAAALREQPAGAIEEAQTAKQRREDVRRAGERLQHEFGFTVRCSAEVRSQPCLRSTRDLYSFLSAYAKDFRPPARAIVVTGRGEIERPLSFENSGTPLALISVREDVRLKNFWPLARDQGWLTH